MTSKVVQNRDIKIEHIENKDLEESVVLKLWDWIPYTYQEYFEKLNKSRWPLEKFKSKMENEYKKSVIIKKGEEILLFFAVSDPIKVDDKKYIKIGFWIFYPNLDKQSRKELLKEAVSFLLKVYKNCCVFLECPADFEKNKVGAFYIKHLKFVPATKRETEIILKSFNRKLTSIREDKIIFLNKELMIFPYTTENTPHFEHIILLFNNN